MLVTRYIDNQSSSVSYLFYSNKPSVKQFNKQQSVKPFNKQKLNNYKQ